MVILHHAGDIVTCPDHSKNYRQRIARYERDLKCRYGVKIYLCPAAAEFRDKTQGVKPQKRDISYCELCTSDKCPKYFRNKIDGEKKKNYKITNSHYRTLADRAAYLKDNAKHRVLFITLTFSNWIDKPITEEDANKCFSKFIENLKKNYSRGNYIAVQERGEDRTRRLHYHLICDLPFHNFITLNSAWNSAISAFCHPSKNALTTDRNARYIKSTVSAVRYICKYISKCRNTDHPARVIFCSREITQAEVTTDFSGNDLHEVLRQYRSIQVYKHHQFCWRYNISTPPGATPEQKERTTRAANAFYYQVVKAMFCKKPPGTAECNPHLYCFPEG